jgi:hypothetical protein
VVVFPVCSTIRNTDEGKFVETQGDYQEARNLFQESLILFKEVADRGGIALSLITLGIIAYHQGD